MNENENSTNDDGAEGRIEIKGSPHTIQKVSSEFEVVEGGPQWVEIEVNDVNNLLWYLVNHADDVEFSEVHMDIPALKGEI